jgi:phospholipase C
MGTFPGADGIGNAGEKAIQTDASGKPYDILPRAMDEKKPDARFPDKLPNKPFLITDYVAATEKTGDLVHRFYQLQEQIDGGRMDHFALVSDAGGLTMGHYGKQNSPIRVTMCWG